MLEAGWTTVCQAQLPFPPIGRSKEKKKVAHQLCGCDQVSRRCQQPSAELSVMMVASEAQGWLCVHQWWRQQFEASGEIKRPECRGGGWGWWWGHRVYWCCSVTLLMPDFFMFFFLVIFWQFDRSAKSSVCAKASWSTWPWLKWWSTWRTWSPTPRTWGQVRMGEPSSALFTLAIK